jgi:3-hydroxy-9,10-secoandrosta-1,3,5(10)-triene-9,17-dione monooxygenase reductase component
MSAANQVLDDAEFRQVMGRFATGVAVVTANDEGEPVGLTIQSFTSLSLAPPLVCFAPGKSSSTWSRIRNAGAFCVNILGDDQEALCRAFAASGADKFAGVGFESSPSSGSPILHGALAWVDCVVDAIHDAGDHDLCIGRVSALGVTESTAGPLLYYRSGFGRFES